MQMNLIKSLHNFNAWIHIPYIHYVRKSTLNNSLMSQRHTVDEVKK